MCSLAAAATAAVANQIDYTDAADDDHTMMPPLQTQSANVPPMSPTGGEPQPGLIMPRKLANPVLESADRKSLHRELLFNQKM